MSHSHSTTTCLTGYGCHTTRLLRMPLVPSPQHTLEHYNIPTPCFNPPTHQKTRKNRTLNTGTSTDQLLSIYVPPSGNASTLRVAPGLCTIERHVPVGATPRPCFPPTNVSQDTTELDSHFARATFWHSRLQTSRPPHQSSSLVLFRA